MFVDGLAEGSSPGSFLGVLPSTRRAGGARGFGKIFFLPISFELFFVAFSCRLFCRLGRGLSGGLLCRRAVFYGNCTDMKVSVSWEMKAGLSVLFG